MNAHTVMTTASGVQVNLARPVPGDLSLDDIAHHLALINRFNGATSRPYSVAQHSVLASWIAEFELGLRDPLGLIAVLLHDAHEAYMGDLTTPCKAALSMSGWAPCPLEAVLEHAVGVRFRLQVSRAAYRDLIRRADLIALATEREALLPAGIPPWPLLEGVRPSTTLRAVVDVDEGWRYWRTVFLDHYHELRRRADERQAAIPIHNPAG